MAAHVPIPTLKLNDGHSIPIFGYGLGTTWAKRGDEGDLDRALVEAVKTAIGLGYKHLDGAEFYGNERELGVAIKESGVRRSELFVTTKVWKGLDDIPKAFEASLEKLGLDYVDLYLIHGPYFTTSATQLQSAWSSLENIHATGKAVSIGVSNFLPHHLTTVLQTAKIKPAINQIEFHTYLQHPPLLQFQREHDVAVAAYSPLSPITKARPGPIDSTLARLSKKYSVSEGEVLLRWVTDQGFVAVTTSRQEGRLREYLGAMKFSLTPEEIKELSEEGLKKHFRGFWTTKFAPDDRS
ncbi:MAG: hypothetical protein M1813_003500 [Trichoglossum hirsutum]|nr:MAG: hypothetical protein M1813_003500 [Trichoglossum hirsutum]